MPVESHEEDPLAPGPPPAGASIAVLTRGLQREGETEKMGGMPAIASRAPVVLAPVLATAGGSADSFTPERQKKDPPEQAPAAFPRKGCAFPQLRLRTACPSRQG